MRKIIFYIGILLLLISCSESEFNTSRTPLLNKRYLFVPTTSLSFDAKPSTQKIGVESDQTDWILNIPVDWVKSNQMNGNSSASLEFSTLLNNSADTSRVCVASISSNVSDWNRSFPITITQKKNNPYIIVSDNSTILSATKQSAYITVSTNTEYTVENTGSSWLHIDSFSSSGVQFSVDENNSGTEREAILTLKAKSYPGTSTAITIRQKIANISSTKEKLTFEHKGSSQTVEIESEVAWKAMSTSWVSVSPMTGEAGKTEVKISVPNNASVKGRTGSVYFNVAEGNYVEIPIEQGGVTLDVSNTTASFDSFGGTQSVTITSNETWQVTSKPDWADLSNTKGEGNGDIQITISENNTTTTKNGDIVITTIDKVTSKTIHVTQNAKHVEYKDATLSYGYNASSQTVSFTTDGNWTLTKDANWFSVDKTSGSGSATLSITVEENNTTASRSGNILLTIAGQPYSITVNQNCKYLTLSSSAFTFSADAGSTKLSIGSNSQWTAKVTEGAEWLSVTPTNGTNNADMTINVSENKTIAARSGRIEIAMPDVQTYIVEVTQNRRYIKTDMASVDLLQSGGQISFNVITDGEYVVSRVGSWFGFTKSGNVITIVAQENTTGQKRSGALMLSLVGLVDGEYSLMIPVCQSVTNPQNIKNIGETIVRNNEQTILSNQ